MHPDPATHASVSSDQRPGGSRAGDAPVSLRLEPVGCDLCGARDSQPLLTLRDLVHGVTTQAFHLVRCRRCGLRYLDPRPVVADLVRVYPDSYVPHRRSGLASAARRWLLRRELRSLWPLLAPPRRILEVGCGSGDLLQLVRELGNPDVIGIEPSRTAAEHARQRWGLDVIHGTLDDAQLPPASVDVALLQHVLEHVPSPSGTLATLARVLRPGGTLLLWLPNVDSWAARAWRSAWLGYDAPRHLYAFDLETLDTLLRRHGFRVTSVHHEWIGIEWSWGVRLALRRRRGGRGSLLDRVLHRAHVPLTLVTTPVSLAAALAGQGGRVRVVARATAATESLSQANDSLCPHPQSGIP